MTLRDEYEAGETILSLSKKHGLGAGTVRRRLLALGTTMRSPNPPITTYPEVVDLYRQGKTRRAIREATGCSDYAYAESLRAAGIVPDFRKKERVS